MFSATVNVLLIATGAAIMLLAIYRSMHLFDILHIRSLKRLWTLQLGLMLFFLSGYLLALWTVSSDNLNALSGITAVIFAFGAVFVLITVHLSVRLSTHLSDLNRKLEASVDHRTTELSEANTQLSLRISQLKQTQARLLQSAKMASVGTLAAGIAHELNNPLAVIQGYLELISEDPEGSNDDRIAKMRKSVDRMRAIVSHLKIFARDSSKDERQPIDIAAPIGDAITFTKHELEHRGIDVVAQFSHGETLIDANCIQLESVFQNLLLNSKDAFSEVADDRDKRVEIKTKLINNTMVIEFIDNATGADSCVLNNMFDAFFTTKKPGDGTGLGLAIAREIVDQHRGKLEVANVVSGGLQFRIEFPVSSRTKEAQPMSQSPPYKGRPSSNWQNPHLGK